MKMKTKTKTASSANLLKRPALGIQSNAYATLLLQSGPLGSVRMPLKHGLRLAMQMAGLQARARARGKLLKLL